MNIEEACMVILGNKNAAAIIADSGIHSAVAEAMSKARDDDNPLALKAIRGWTAVTKVREMLAVGINIQAVGEVANNVVSGIIKSLLDNIDEQAQIIKSANTDRDEWRKLANLSKAMWEDAEADLSTAPAGDGVPGMVLVPKVPTDAMYEAARFYLTDRWTLQGHSLALSELWSAMLSASTAGAGVSE
jgi:predicted RecA/RadA family phage recombinase